MNTKTLQLNQDDPDQFVPDPELPVMDELGLGHVEEALRRRIVIQVLLVPVERIELPTFGLQNRC